MIDPRIIYAIICIAQGHQIGEEELKRLFPPHNAND